MSAVDLIRKKRDSGEHSREELEFLISGYTNGDMQSAVPGEDEFYAVGQYQSEGLIGSEVSRSQTPHRPISHVCQGGLLFLISTHACRKLTEVRTRPKMDGRYRSYYVHISNESDGLPWHSFALAQWLTRVGDLLGYRYISFDAGVLVQDGKVSQADYGLANQWMRPQAAGYVGYMVTARSVHGFWLPTPLQISSVEDYSPQYRPTRWGNTLAVIYTSDAPPEMTKRIFDLNLTCFLVFGGCEDARMLPTLPQRYRET